MFSLNRKTEVCLVSRHKTQSCFWPLDHEKTLAKERQLSAGGRNTSKAIGSRKIFRTIEGKGDARDKIGERVGY